MTGGILAINIRVSETRRMMIGMDVILVESTAMTDIPVDEIVAVGPDLLHQIKSTNLRPAAATFRRNSGMTESSSLQFLCTADLQREIMAVAVEIIGHRPAVDIVMLETRKEGDLLKIRQGREAATDPLSAVIETEIEIEVIVIPLQTLMIMMTMRR